MTHEEGYRAGMQKMREVGGQRIEEQREWVGLTKDEIIDIIIAAFGSPYDVAVDVEAKLKERNT